jgi:subtilase family serine protease
VAALPVDAGFEVVIDADNEHAESNEYDNVRPSGCSNVQ